MLKQFHNGWYLSPDKDDSGNLSDPPAVAQKTDTGHMVPKERLDEVISQKKDYEKRLLAAEEALDKFQKERLKNRKTTKRCMRKQPCKSPS